MGNCVSEQTEERIQTKEVTEESVASTVSACSAPCMRLPTPLLNEFVATDHCVVLSELLTSVADPQKRSLVVINAKTGIAILSVARISNHQFSVFTPDGGLVGTISISQSAKGRIVLELPLKARGSYKAAREQNGALRLLANNAEVCSVNSSDSSVTADSIHRGVDLVIAFALAAVADL